VETGLNRLNDGDGRPTTIGQGAHERTCMNRTILVEKMVCGILTNGGKKWQSAVRGTA